MRILNFVMISLCVETCRARIKNVTFDEMIQTKAFAVLQILDHVVGEAVHVPGSLEYRLRCEDGTIHLQHLFFENEEVSPSIEKIGFHCAAHGSEIVLAGNATINFKRLDEKEAPFKQVLHPCSIKRIRRWSKFEFLLA